MSNRIIQTHDKALTARAQTVNNRTSKQFYDQFVTDVTGTWLGYNNNKGEYEGHRALGKVLYEGTVYQATVISPLGIPKGSKVNLRRTKNKNFVDW